MYRVMGIKSSPLGAPKRLVFVLTVVGVVFLALFYYGMQMINQAREHSLLSPSDNGSGETAESVQQQTLAQSEIQPIAPSSDQASKSSAKIETVTNTETQAQAAKNSKASAPCTLDTDILVKDYSAETRKAKDTLDSNLSYLLVGTLIKSGYIDQYNRTVADLHESFTDRAAKANCSFPVAKPTLLTGNYTGE